MANILSRAQRLDILERILTGTTYRTTALLTETHRTTCMNLVHWFGISCEVFLRREMKDLSLGHVQCDEIKTHVKKKWYNVEDDDPDAELIGEIWLFRALDEETRLMPAHYVGKRNDATTGIFIRRLASCIKRPPKPHVTDRHAYEKREYKPLLRISTDGWASYERVIDETFGPYVQYGQLIKRHYVETKDNKRIKRVKLEQRVVLGRFDANTISTSLVERSNGTSRTFLRNLFRKTNGYAKKLESLRAAVSAHMCWYNYCWKISTLKTSPAHAAGIANRQWSLGELYDHVLAA
jgi:IS1 family transposase